MTAEVDALLEDYEFGKLCEALYHFAWDEVCDWYLELAKAALPGPAGQTTRAVLGYVLEALLRSCSTRSSRSSPKNCGRR